MADLAMYFLVLGLVVAGLSILTRHSGGKGLLPVGMMTAGLGAAMMAPAGWPRYTLAALFVGFVVWTLVGTTTTVLYRYRWGVIAVGVAVVGIVIVEFSPGVVGDYEGVVLNVIGLILIAGLATLVYLSLSDLRAAGKQSR